MQGDSNYWEVDCGDLGIFKISERQMEFILAAEKRGERLVRLDKAVISIPFIRGMRERREQVALPEPERKPFEPTESGLKALEDLRGLISKKRA